MTTRVLLIRSGYTSRLDMVTIPPHLSTICIDIVIERRNWPYHQLGKNFTGHECVLAPPRFFSLYAGQGMKWKKINKRGSFMEFPLEYIVQSTGTFCFFTYIFCIERKIVRRLFTRVYTSDRAYWIVCCTWCSLCRFASHLSTCVKKDCPGVTFPPPSEGGERNLFVSEQTVNLIPCYTRLEKCILYISSFFFFFFLFFCVRLFISFFTPWCLLLLLSYFNRCSSTTVQRRENGRCCATRFSSSQPPFSLLLAPRVVGKKKETNRTVNAFVRRRNLVGSCRIERFFFSSPVQRVQQTKKNLKRISFYLSFFFHAGLIEKKRSTFYPFYPSSSKKGKK